MPEYLERESNTITIANFFEAYQLEKYNFDPEYQRKSVWTDEKKSFLINSIIKNFPIPPVFLHQKIDNETGKTTYDVIDGKQRLTAIIAFLKNEIPITDEEEESDIAGLYFEDFDNAKNSELKKRIWRYTIPIEYVDTDDQSIIDSIFDRLNRNGEPLTGQELRNANYYNSSLLLAIDEGANLDFWKDRLAVVDKARMEDIEFVSELFLFLHNGEEKTSSPSVVDQFYKDCSNLSPEVLGQIKNQFEAITEFMERLNINYDLYSVGGVSHLYGLFAFCKQCKDQEIAPQDISEKLDSFFKGLRDLRKLPIEAQNEDIVSYKASMSSNTKSSSSRVKRREALINFCVVS